jgi:hypothetical protein
VSTDVSEKNIASIFRIEVQTKRKILPPESPGLLLGLLCNPEDGGDMFLRNVSPNYTALKPRKPFFSWSLQ